MKKEKAHKVPNTAPFSIIEITARYCSDKIQSNVRLKNRYVVIKVEELKDGTPALTVQDPTQEKYRMRINAKRFCWRLVSAAEIVSEQQAKENTEKIKTAIDILDNNFSKEEQKNILLIPSAILEIALYYARGTYDLCRGDKKKKIDGLSEYKSLGRELSSLLEEMDKEAVNSLSENKKQLEHDVNDFIQNNFLQFFRLKNVINMEYKRIDAHSSDRVLDVRTNAVCALYFLAMFEIHENEVDNMIGKKLGKNPVHQIADNVIKLKRILAKYAEVYKFGFKENQNMVIGFKGIKNAISKMDFNINQIRI